MPEPDRHIDLVELESPVTTHGHHVVDPPVRPAPHGLLIGLDEQRLDRRVVEDELIGGRHLRQQMVEQAARLGGGTQRLPQQPYLNRRQVRVARLGELADVLRRHPREPVHPGIVGRHADQGGHAVYPVRQQRRGGQGVRPSSRTADHAEALEAEAVGDRRDVRGGVAHPPVRVPIGAPVSRPVIRDQADATPVEDARPRSRSGAAARGAVQEEDRPPVGRAGVGGREEASIGGLHLVRRVGHPVLLSRPERIRIVSSSDQESA
ncbi:hypothetical protein Adi01nite_00970 [Amorphoplanes digitatis]|nr:hypothetical protein Adi01nite_00970 [Actinoplanes digitatis]